MRIARLAFHPLTRLLPICFFYQQNPNQKLLSGRRRFEEHHVRVLPSNPLPQLSLNSVNQESAITKVVPYHTSCDPLKNAPIVVSFADRNAILLRIRQLPSQILPPSPSRYLQASHRRELLQVSCHAQQQEPGIGSPSGVEHPCLSISSHSRDLLRLCKTAYRRIARKETCRSCGLLELRE